MSPEEAKTKWCPFARIGGSAGTEGASYNRLFLHGGEISHDAATCIADQCMAWRWTDRENAALGIKYSCYFGLAGRETE